MGTPNNSSDPSAVAVDMHPVRESSAPGSDPLAEIGETVAALKQRDVRSAESAAHVLEGREAFFAEFRQISEAEVRPAMQAVVDRLRREGGDGVIEAHPGGEPRVATPRMTLWMSLQGPIEGAPRQDRNPYLQLDADVTAGVVRLTEGDSWGDGGAGHSGAAGTWNPADITRELVMREAADIVRRSARISPA